MDHINEYNSINFPPDLRMEHKKDLIKLLHTSSDTGIDALTEVVVKITSASEEFNLEEVFELLSNAEHDYFWSCVDTVCTSLLDTLDSNHELKEGIDVKCVANLRPIASYILHFFTSFNFRPAALRNCTQRLHDILIPLEENIPGARELKNSISKTCERCWLENEEGAEALIPQLIPYLLLTSLETNCPDANVKRIYAMRYALCLLDYEDASIQTIQGLLLRCYVDSKFLRVAEGRRFLSFLFSLHQDLHMLILGVMKPQLGVGNLTVAEAYGDILLRAWKDIHDHDGGRECGFGNAGHDVALLTASLEEVLQDVVHTAIHAAEKKYFESLRTVLSVFHEKKNVKDVDAMLLRVYGPILWRSLRSANPVVRAQAALIFFEAFPLQSPDTMSTIELEALLQKQFDLLPALLKDVDHRVRATAAYGVCRILREFWEVIPPGTTHQILSYVVATLGVDGSSAAVRAAVVNGLTELLSNPLAHTALRGLLPAMAHTAHDVSDRVRLCFIKLLCKVKVTRGFKFYEIVTVENLCAQLSMDAGRPAICSAMTELLLNSFYPRASPAERELNADASTMDYGSEQIKRCLQFVQSHESAALVFYANLFKHTSVGSAMKLAVMLWKLLIASKTPPGQSTDEGEGDDDEDERLGKKGAKCKSKKKKNHNKQTEELLSRAKRRREKEVAKACHEDEQTSDTLHFPARVAYHTLIVIESLLKSIRSKLPERSYVLSKEMFLDNFTPALIRRALNRLRHLEVTSEEGSDDFAESHASLLCLLNIMSIRMSTPITGAPADKKSTQSVKKKSGVRASTHRNFVEDDFVSCDELIGMYFEDGKDDELGHVHCQLQDGFSSCLLDAVLALHSCNEATLATNTSKNQFATLPLWNALKKHFSILVDVLGLTSVDGNDTGTSCSDTSSSSPIVEKIRGKRRGTSSLSEVAKKPRAFQCLAPDSTALISLVKSVGLLSSLIAGKSETTSAYRDHVVATDEVYSHALDIFAIIHRAIKDILDTPHSHDMLLQRWGDASTTVEDAIATCTGLWVTLSVHRDALSEERELNSATEVSEVLDWVSSSLLPPLTVTRGTNCMSLTRLVDKIYASAIGPLADALLMGVTVEPILVALGAWSSQFVSALPCCRALSNHETTSGLTRCPLVHSIPSLSRVAYVLSSEAILFDRTRISNKASIVANMHNTWLLLVDIIVAHTATHAHDDATDHESQSESSLMSARSAILSTIGKTANAEMSYNDTKSAADGRKAERSRLLIIKCLEHALNGVVMKPSFKNTILAGKSLSSCGQMIASRDITDWVEWDDASFPLARPCFDMLQKKLSASADRKDVHFTICNHLVHCVKKGMKMCSPHCYDGKEELIVFGAATLLKYFMCHATVENSRVSTPEVVSSVLSFLDGRVVDKENAESLKNCVPVDTATDRDICGVVASLLRL